MATITALQCSTMDNMLTLFESQVSHSPDLIALLCGDQQLTYRELDRRANQLAWHLQKLSVKPETLVGVCTSRSLDMIVAILGVLKAGGAYVPLDPSYPKERLSFILEDAQAPVVITQSEFSGSFSSQQVQTVCMDLDSAEISLNPVEPPFSLAFPENLACVIYTSGSTGKPKGVMVTHSNLLSFVRISGLALNVTSTDVYIQTASIAYALSVRQIMIPLCVGATLVIATSDEMRDPIALFNLIRSKNVSLMDMVPSFWRTCLQRLSDLSADELGTLMDNSLRRIVSIGEPLSSDLPQEWISRFGSRVMLVNIFGQTETTGVVATHLLSQDAPARTEIVPIGHAVPDTRLYFLDENLHPVPPGESGELCVSNPCIARGYLNQPDLTDRKFIPNPFNDGISTRLYRTGDMARMREDGNIEYLGRGDYQVKIRGQRLELGEIEMILRKHASIRECVVTARNDQPDEKYLVAYIIASDGTLTASGVREFLRNHLPDYMIPSAFVFVEKLPLTPNGKIDRLGLPDPSTVIFTDPISNSCMEPRNHIERTIVNIWKDLLKLEHVGIHDNYFDLGGHSLMSVRMFTRIEREFGVRLPFTTLFNAMTIAQIAGLVSNANEDVTRWKIVVPVQPYGENPPFFGVHGLEGGVLFWRDMVLHLPQNQPFYALQALGVDGIQTPLNSIPGMAALYIKEMRKVQPCGPYYIGGYSLGGEVAFEMAQQLVRQGEQVNLLVMFDTRNPKRAIRPMVRTGEGTIAPEFKGTPPSGKFETLKRKIKGHYLKWSVLEPRAKIGYVVNQISVHIRRFVVMLSVGFFRVLGKRLPDTLLLHYLRMSHGEALTNYVPLIYSGKVTLFRASETLSDSPDHSLLGWAPLSAGGLDVHYFNATHEIMRPEYSHEVALKLNECLTKARSLNQRNIQ